LSIGVILSAGIIYFCAPNGHVWSYWQLADPICTYLFSIMAIYSTISIAKEAITILLDGCDDPKLVQDI
jgi:zinc transporter 2